MTQRLGALGVLVVLAFMSGCASTTRSDDGPGSADSESPATAPPTIRRADLKLEYTLDAVTARSDRIAIVTNDQLRFVPRGGPDQRTVQAGTPVGRLVVSQAARDALSAPGAGGAASRLAGLEAQQREVRAPVDAVLHASGRAPSFAAPGLDVVAALTPIQYLRYLSMPFSGTAQVETVLGPTTVRCAALWSTPVEATNESAAALHCRLPAGVQTAPGLRSTVTMRSTELKDVLLAPNLSIGYDERTDRYSVSVIRDGDVVRVPVEVGVTDGVVRVIRGAVRAGDQLAPPVTADP
ncbi:hypothetical protein [Nocardioides marmoriginsengisoli]|uniref:hypothetical protein n=1 Tax=Nocardioides marmoriginsengisoli TaxID=661483 RepID=UPI00161F26D1|nr:hypothetical protein [Nocardioides marmoriginsengisoli]